MKHKSIYQLVTIFSVFLFSCNAQEKIDLSKLALNEPIEKLIDFKDKNLIGVETIEYPFCLIIEIENEGKYNFDGIDLKGQKVFLQINAEVLKTDSIVKTGGGHIDVQTLKDKATLANALKRYKADDEIYGIKIEMKTKAQQEKLLKSIEARYGKGIKNPNTDHGLYWNVKKEHKYIFFAPDYNRLTILNSTHLSKTCYWDIMNGVIDFGGCDIEAYNKDLIKNTSKPKEIKDADKAVIKIGKDWSLNELKLGMANESDFVSSGLNKNFERNVLMESTGSKVFYAQNESFYVYFTLNKGGEENDKVNTFEGYYVNDLKNVNVAFEAGWKSFAKKEGMIKAIGKDQI